MHRNYNLGSFCKKLLGVAIDLLTVSLIFSAFVFIKKSADDALPLAEYFKLWPFLFLFWLVFEKTGLYEGISIHSGSALGTIEEVRRLFYAISAIFVAIGCANFCYRPDGYLYSRTVLIGTYLCCLFFIPFHRLLFRNVCARIGFWGVPAVIIGSGETARKIFDIASRNSKYGIRPIGYFTNNKPNRMPETALCLGTLAEIPEKIKSLVIKYAILAKDEDPNGPVIQQVIRQYGILFPHLLFIPKAPLLNYSDIAPKDIGGVLGFEVRHNLQIPQVYRLKRIIDFLLTIPCLIAALPLMGLIAIWVKADSPGPILFKHQRIAKNGQQITIYKFRTMANGADEELNDLLRKNPELQSEFKIYGKLENDPRITRVGKWLRATSFDELPQFFNILQGKLTLVGPRPIIEKEKSIYGENADLFNRVLPGLTGLWQVSGRNNLTYEERMNLDMYYANNWSVWLDLFILVKTVHTVLFRHGAK